MKKVLGLIIVVILSFWTIRPLLTAGYFPMHDDTQVTRVIEMGRALREGQFPVRWVSDLGYGLGYPIFNFYGPLPYYVGGFFYAIGISGLASAKIMMGLGLVLAGVAMYLAIADIAGISAGVIAAVFYMYAPYHAVDAYVRGAVGEYWTLVFLPLIFWGFWRKNFLLGAVGLAGLVLSHTVLGYAGMFFVLVSVGVMRFRKEAILLILLGLGLSAFFWLPALTEMKFTGVASVVGGAADFRNHFVCIGQLWNSPWGFGGSAPGCLDGLSFKIGKEHLIFAFFAAVSALFIVKTRKSRQVVFAGLAILSLSVFFMLQVSEPVWSILPLFSFVQYPWRFLTFAIFGVSVMASGVLFAVRPPLLRWVIVLTAIGLVLSIEVKRFAPQYIYERPASVFETPMDLRFRVSKISDEYLPPAILKPVSPQEALRDTIPASDDYTVRLVENLDTYKKFEFLSGVTSSVRVNVAYFPGWVYRVNDNTVVPSLDHGLPVLTVPSGLTVVQMWFEDTPIRKIANGISLVAVGVWFYLYDKRKKIFS